MGYGGTSAVPKSQSNEKSVSHGSAIEEHGETSMPTAEDTGDGGAMVSNGFETTASTEYEGSGDPGSFLNDVINGVMTTIGSAFTWTSGNPEPGSGGSSEAGGQFLDESYEVGAVDGSGLGADETTGPSESWDEETTEDYGLSDDYGLHNGKSV